MKNYYPKALAALLAILLLGASTLTAQNAADSAYAAQMEKVRKLNWKKQLEVGKVLYKKGSYYNAIDVLQMSYNAKPEKNHCGAYLLAASYYQARDYVNAETYFNKVLEIDSNKHPYTYYYLGQSLKRQGRYEEAKTAFNLFKTTEPSKISAEFTALQKTVPAEVAGCDLGIRLMGDKTKAEVRHLDRGANHPLTDYSPVELAGGRLLYAALANDTLIDVTDSSITSQQRYTRLYVTTQGNEVWAKGQLFDVPFNTGDYHIGNGIYSPDSSKFYFTRCTETEVITKMHCEIWVSTRSGGTWGEAKMVGNGISANKHSSTHPYSVLDENGREVLFFSSDRQGGQGGMDIWYTYPDLKGNYSAPVNAGTNVNTKEDDITPSYHAAKRTLYFSSVGHVNIGGHDIYSSVKDSLSGFGLPEHMGFPLNSSVDDMYYRPSTGTRGFLVSNRTGGYNLKSPNCCDDILSYSFPPTNVFVEGQVVENIPGGLPITDAIVYIYRKDNDSLVASAALDSLGKYRFRLDGGPEYVVVAGDNVKYVEQRKGIVTNGLEDNGVITQNFQLDRNAYWPGMVVGKIHFKFDRYDLMKGGTATLDSVVAFLKANPKVRIEVAGHADSKGDSTYNQGLSMRRSETAFSYLTIIGKVNGDRLVKKWYGEDRPAVPNTNPDGSDNPTNRQLNRRTEFVIIGDVEETAMP